jgi:hypothetical protein
MVFQRGNVSYGSVDMKKCAIERTNSRVTFVQAEIRLFSMFSPFFIMETGSGNKRECCFNTPVHPLDPGI